MSTADSAPRYRVIQRDLLEQIRAGRLPPGARTPSENELADRYGVSRMTARKSLDGLVARHMLRRQPGKGTYVAEGVLAYGLSTMLSFSRTLREQGHEVTTRVLRQGLMPAPQSVAAALQLATGQDVVIARRLRTVDGTPAAIHAAYFDARWYRPLLDADLEQASLLEVAESISHVTMAYSQESVSAIPARPEAAKLLGVAAGDPVLEVEGVVFDETDAPVRLTRALYRGDRFRLGVRSTERQVSSLAFTSA